MKNIKKGLKLLQGIRIIGLLFVLSAGLFLVSPIAHALTFATIDVPGSVRTVAFGINPSGHIVGLVLDSGFAAHGFLLDKKGDFKTIDPPGSTFTVARGINPSGQIVGGFDDSSGGHGFLLDKKGNFTTIDVPGSVGTEAFGISPSGRIVGVFDDSSGGHGFLASP